MILKGTLKLTLKALKVSTEVEREPDPYAVVEIGVTSYTTTTIPNTIAPIWAESFTAFIDDATPYSVIMYDEDDAEDAVIMEFGTEEPPIWFLQSWNLRRGGLSISQGTMGEEHHLNIVFIPQ